jgi:hypothetical protein
MGMSVRTALAVLAGTGTLATLFAGSASHAATVTCQRAEVRSLVLISARTGAVNRFLDVDRVYVVLADGRGGWFVGGGFTCVGGVAATGLAHLEADGSLDTSWQAVLPVDRDSESGVVVPRALALADGRLLVGGPFGIEALDATTGAREWSVPVGAPGVRFPLGVDALATNGRRVYVGGDFRTIGGTTRDALAALDLHSGRVLPWRPHVNKPQSKAPVVSALALSGTRLYVGSGGLVFAGQRQWPGIAALGARTGRVLAWTPQKKGYTGYLAVGDVESILVEHGEVLTAGHDGWGVTSERTGRIVPWSHQTAARYFTAVGDLVYLGGDCRNSLTVAAGMPRNNLAAINLTTARFTGWAPNVNKYTCVDAMAASADQVLVAGGFTQSLG